LKTFPGFDLRHYFLVTGSQSIVQTEDCCGCLHETFIRQKANIRKIGKTREEFVGELGTPLLWGRKC